MGVNRKVLGDDIVEFIHHGGDGLHFIRVDLGRFIFILFLGCGLLLLLLFRLLTFRIFILLHVFLCLFVDLLLFVDLRLDISHLLLECLFEMRLKLIETLLQFV